MKQTYFSILLASAAVITACADEEELTTASPVLVNAVETPLTVDNQTEDRNHESSNDTDSTITNLTSPRQAGPEDYEVGGYYPVKMNLIFANKNPYIANSPHYFADNETITLSVSECEVTALCWKKVKEKAQFVFIPPVPQYTTFTHPKKGTLISMIPAHAFSDEAKKQFTYDEKVMKALPSMSQVGELTNFFRQRNQAYFESYLKNMPVTLPSTEKCAHSTDQLMNYNIDNSEQIESFFQDHKSNLESQAARTAVLKSGPELLYMVSMAFAYKKSDGLCDLTNDYQGYFCCPTYLRWGKLFYNNIDHYDNELQYQEDNYDTPAVLKYACSFITNESFLEPDAKKENFEEYMIYYCPYQLKGMKNYDYKLIDRPVSNKSYFPLRVLYFAEVNL